ncbi:hypothetical protein ACIQU2_27490 [Pseudomonas sp. NPDC098740]|uniref:hypothetical protein n=1 Tax=Pseudomonas sp. NPDC098740 TaxID=3364486 RepID=UPI00383B63E0
MNLHPLFAGFKGESPYAVGAALGFAIHVETALGPLPAALDPRQRERTREGGDLADFQFAGGWGAPGAHCLMFAKPLTRMAAAWWRAGEAEVVHAPKLGWDAIVDLVSEVLGCEYERTPGFHIGHQMPGINFNSLARIIDRVRHCPDCAAIH